MISQSGNVAVNAIGSRRGIDFHTVISTGNQAVCSTRATGSPRSPSATASARWRCSSSPTATAPSSPRRSPRCAERGRRRRGAQGRLLGGRRARRRRAHRRARRRPAGLPRAGRGGRRRLGRATPHELLELARALAEPARAPARAPAGSRCSPARAATPGSPPTRPSGSGIELPELAPAPTARRARRAAARGGDGRQPARLHLADLGRDRAPAPRSPPTVGDDPAIDQLLLCYDHPARPRPSTSVEWAAVREGLAAGALESRAGGPVRLDPARPARRATPRASSPRGAAGDRRPAHGARLRAARCARPRGRPGAPAGDRGRSARRRAEGGRRRLARRGGGEGAAARGAGSPCPTGREAADARRLPRGRRARSAGRWR